MQVKIDTPIKVELLAKLKKEGLTFKDLVQASIDVYLGRSYRMFLFIALICMLFSSQHYGLWLWVLLDHGLL